MSFSLKYKVILLMFARLLIHSHIVWLLCFISMLRSTRFIRIFGKRIFGYTVAYGGPELELKATNCPILTSGAIFSTFVGGGETVEKRDV